MIISQAEYSRLLEHILHQPQAMTEGTPENKALNCLLDYHVKIYAPRAVQAQLQQALDHIRKQAR